MKDQKTNIRAYLKCWNLDFEQPLYAVLIFKYARRISRIHRGASLIKKRLLLGPYSSLVPRGLG